MLKSVPPVARLQYKSMADRSNENGAWFRNVSARVVNFCSANIQLKKCCKQASVMTTPLGSPVLPLVNRM